MAGEFIPVSELLKQSGGSNQQGQGQTGFVPVRELLKNSGQQSAAVSNPQISAAVTNIKQQFRDLGLRLSGNAPVHPEQVTDQYIADYIDLSQKYYNNALIDQETGSWEYMTNPIAEKERKRQAMRLKTQNENIRAWFKENINQFDSQEYDSYMEYLDGLEKQFDGVGEFYKQVGQFNSQDEYTAASKRWQWQQQYMNPEMLAGIGRLEELQRNDGSMSEIKGTEQSLQRMAGNIDLTSVKQRIDQLSGMINTAQLKGENTYQLEQEQAQLQTWYDAVRYYKYIGKYSDMTYEQLQQNIIGNQQLIDNAGNMPDVVWQRNNTTPEQLQDEQDWLKAYAPGRKTKQDESKEHKQLTLEMANDSEYYNRLLRSDPVKAAEEEASLRSKYQIPDDVEDIHSWFVAQAQAMRDHEKYGYLRENADFEEKSQYDPNKGKTDLKYKAIGNWFETSELTDMIYRKYQNMDWYQVENYLYLYNTKGKKVANDYLDSIDAELTSLYTEELREGVNAAVADNPWLGLMSAPANFFLSPLGGGEYGAKSLLRGAKYIATLDNQRPVNMSSLGLLFGTFGDNLNSATVNYIAENYDGIGEKLLTGGYQLGNQAIQMGLQYLTGQLFIGAGLSPKVASGITSAIMSGSAYTSTVLDVRARGGTDEQAMASGIAAGVFEWLFEHYEIDQLLQAGDGGFVRSFLRNALTEGFGEGATTLANGLADMIINGDLSNFDLSVEAYKEKLIAGGVSPEEAELRARKQAWIDFGTNVGTDAFMGALGGGLFGSFKSVVSNTQTKKAFGGARSGLLVDNILETDPDNKLAQQAQERLTAGKNLSADMLSRLVAQNPEIATKTLNYINRAYTDEFTGQSGTQWHAAQGKLLSAIPDDVLARTAQKLGKTALTFDIIELQNDPEAQQAWKDAGLTWEQLGQTYVKMPALRDEIAWRAKYSKMRSKFSAPTTAQTTAATQQEAPAGNVSSPGTTPAQQMVQWAEGAFSRGEITQEELEAIRAEAVAYDSGPAAAPAGNVSVPDTQPNAAAQPVIPGGNGSTVSNLGTPAIGTVDPALTEKGPSGTPVPTEGGTFVPAEKPGKVRLKDPFVNAPKELFDMAQRIAEMTGREIVLFREQPGEHGVHDGYELNGTLYINVLGADPLAAIWGHEYCHSFEQTKEHEQLKNGLKKLFLRKGIDMKSLCLAKQELYKKNGVNIVYAGKGIVQLENEVVASYTSQLLRSEADIKAMVEFDPTVIQRLSHWVDSVLAAFGKKDAAERVFLYDAKKLLQKALSGGTALKKQTEHRDVSAEFNTRRQELESMLADGRITDEEYESGIAALDEEQLLQVGRTDQKKHSYAGINALTVNVGKLDDAKQMLSEGVDAETIRQQTGWFQGRDGKWRFEIDDSSMEVANKIINYMTLGELVKHDALFAAYPNLADITVSFQSLPFSTMAQYDKADDHIYIDYLLKNDITYLKDVLIHEIQHVIQGWEGYESGASVEYWKQKIREGFDAKSRTANNLYWNTAGEIEARDAADRRTLSEEERKKRHPNVGGEDVVFAENGIVAQNFVGWTADGNEVYQTSQATLGMSTSDRIAKFKSDFVNNFKGRTAKLNRNGHTVYAHFSNSTSVFGKLTYEGTATSSRSSSNGYKAKIRLLADGNVFELVEDAVYDDSKQETGKKKHKNAQHWDYFVKTIVVDGKAFDVLISVRMDVTNGNWNTKERYVYSIRFRDNKTVATSVASPATSKVQHQNDVATEDSIAENNPGVNGNFQNTDDGNEVSHSFSPVEGADTASTEATGADVKDPVVSRDTLNTKARNYLRSAENDLQRQIAKALNVPLLWNREYLTKVAQEISDEYFRTGQLSDDAITRIFNDAYEQCIVQAMEFYNQCKHIKDELQTVVKDLSKQDQAAIETQGINQISEAYMKFSKVAPELFPESISLPADQLKQMSNAVKSIRNAENTLKLHHQTNENDFKQDAKHEFTTAIEKSMGKIRDVVRYAEDNSQKDTPQVQILTEEQAMEVGKKMNQAQIAADKAVRNNLLTQSDAEKVGKLLCGEMSPESLNSSTDNVAGILAVYEAKKEYEQYAKQFDVHKRAVKAEYRSLAEGYLKNVESWKHKGFGLAYSRDTMWRNVQDIVPDPELARQINEEYFFAVNRAEAKSTKFKNDFRNRVRKLQLSRKVEKGNLVSEAHAVQLYGEALDNIRILNSNKFLKTRDGKTLSEWQAVIQKLWEENPNLDHAKIQNAVNEFRKIYDELFSMMNEVRVRNGYEPVKYRQGYFPHFQPGEETVITQFGKVFGFEQSEVLPTTINGLTHTFRPGTQWFGHTQERLGFATAYDALEGFDKYIEGIAGVIHHTDNIQKLRALASQIRYMASDKGLRERIDEINAKTDMTEEEKQIIINNIWEKGKYDLAGFVVELEEYTNLLAGKKSRRDRILESDIGRPIYIFLKKWESRIASNLVGLNFGSAFTNLIPFTQAWGRIRMQYLLWGMWDTLRNGKKHDSIPEMSDFLTNRRGSDPIVRGFMQKASNITGKPMEWMDTFVSQSIVRAAYYQYKSHNMSDANAMHCADLLAAGIIADRSRGSMPTIFAAQNPLTKLFTQFQLEVNNQVSEIFKDLPRHYRNRKWALIGAYIKYFWGACLFNALFELLTGRRPALDPIDMLFGLGEDIVDATKGEKGVGDVVVGFTEDLAGSLPFMGLLSLAGIETQSSRLPISNSMIDFKSLLNNIGEGDWREAFTDVAEPAIYALNPFGGGGQLLKTYKGTKAYIQGGSYTKTKDGDKLQYIAEKDTSGWDAFGNAARSVLFGKNAVRSFEEWKDMELGDWLSLIAGQVPNSNSQEWVDGGFKSLSVKHTAAYQDLRDCGMIDRDAFKYINEFAAITGENKSVRQREFVLDSDLNDEAKKVMVGVMLGTEMKEDSGNPSAYAKFLDCLDFGLTVDDYLQLRQDGGDVDRFLEFAEAGLEHSDCSKLSVTIGGLEPEKGKKQVSNQQRWRTVIQTVDDPEQQLTALSTMMSDSQYAKCSVACDNGLDPDLWVMMQEVLPMYDKDENGAYNQEEITKAIDAVGGDLGARAVAGWWGLDIAKGYRHMSKKEKAVLWQLLTGSPSAKNNPYDVKAGEKVLEKYTKLRDDLEDDE